jgi:predicted outer membrane protein
MRRHRASNQRAVSPSPNSLTTTRESDAKRLTSSMSTQSGADFDRSYVDARVPEHQELLVLIDSQLLPIARRRKWGLYFRRCAGRFRTHLKEAKEIQSKLTGSW